MTNKSEEVLRGLASTLNGSRTRWTNGKTSVYHDVGEQVWYWITPEGAGSSDEWEDALNAVYNWLFTD